MEFLKESQPSTTAMYNYTGDEKIFGLDYALKEEEWKKCIQLIEKYISLDDAAYTQLQDLKSENICLPLDAAARGYKELIQVLLCNGLDVNHQFTGDRRAMLHSAAWYGRRNVVELLLERGVHTDVKNCRGWTPLHCAARKGHLNVILLLLDAGADINATDDCYMTPLHHAALGGHASIVEFLVDNKCNQQIKNYLNKRALDLAREYGNEDIANILLRGDEKIFGLDYTLKEEEWKKCMPLIEKYISLDDAAYNQLQDLKTKNVCLPLEAAARGYKELIQVLLCNGLNVNCQFTGDRRAMLHSAAWCGHRNVVELLLERGAHTDVKNCRGLMPLHSAACKGHLNVILLLLDAGADINATDDCYMTPLHHAALGGHASVVEFLVDNKCNKHIKNHLNKRALDIAIDFGNEDIINILSRV